MSKPDPQWQRTTSLRKVEQYRKELAIQGREAPDLHIATFAAEQVGATPAQVLT